MTSNFKQVSANISDVTEEQMGHAHLIIRSSGNFYIVESQTSDEEYEVRYTREHGYTCTCKAGQYGFAHVKHASGVCWHVRAAVACQIEEQVATALDEEAEIARREHEAETDSSEVQAAFVNGAPIDSATLKRVNASAGQSTKERSHYTGNPFNLMRSA